MDRDTMIENMQLYKRDAEFVDLDSYQAFVQQTSWNGTNLLWAGSAIASEVGEVNQLIEKVYRKGTPIDPEKFKDELSDVLWNIAFICNAVDIDLEDVFTHNIRKIADRTIERLSQDAT